ncbi:MAG TPA: BCD family MFS transporter [Crinalium sp.]|jgi:BCD family chlorophyll transporter-like MFS transporter
MTPSNLSNQEFYSEHGKLSPKIGLPTIFRLGLFQMGLGIMSILTLGLLNRVMIKELAIAPTLVALILAVPYFVAPARVWFGQLSDSKPILGTHRTGYVWISAALLTVVAFLAVQVVWQLGASLPSEGCAVAASGWDGLREFFFQPNCSQSRGWAGLLAIVFACYGLVVSAGSTPFAALLVDVSDEDNRPKLVGIVWAMLIFGTIMAAGGIFGSLSTISVDAPIATLQRVINILFIVIPVIVLLLSITATVGVEKKFSRYKSRSVLVNREDQITLGRAWKILTASRQTGVFFTFLIVMTMGLFMQDAVLEAYGGEVFGMAIAQTTLLNVFFGVGTIVSMTMTGFLIVPRLGKQPTTRLGCLLVALCTVLLIVSGLVKSGELLQFSMLLFGLAAGITTTGAISLMLDLTAAETAGTFIGAWGLSQAWARGIATVSGGVVLDIGKTWFGSSVFSYALVFAAEGIAMLIAVVLLSRVNVQEFITSAKDAIATVLESDLD